MMEGNTLGWVITVAVFGGVGGCVGFHALRPARAWVFLSLLALAVVGFFIGRHVRLLSILGIEIYLNWAIVAACAGGLCGMLAGGRRAGGPQTP